jgi:Flp pilus assembly protein TadB
MGLIAVRIVLPALIAIAGVVLLIVGDDAARGAGIVLIGVAVLVVLANLFMRLSLQSERDRRREAARRERM